MLKTDSYIFKRKGVFEFIRPMKYQEFKKAMEMCKLHAKRKKIRQPSDWVYVPLLTDAV